MTIDPTKFEPQGAPTREQVRTVWDAHPKPSSRKIEALLVGRGFEISFRTIARWKRENWAEDAVKPLAEKGQVRGVKKELKAELAKIPPATVAEAEQIAAAGGLDAAIAGGKLGDEDYKRIDGWLTELRLVPTEAELDAVTRKERKMLNIVLMREAQRRAHIMVLIPKDTGSLVVAFTDAEVAPTSPIQEIVSNLDARNGDSARVIEGKVNLPLTPIQLKMHQLREDGVLSKREQVA